MKKYQLIVTGGTFDRLHRGHESFLQYAFSISEKVLIGLTTDQFSLEKRPGQSIQSYTTREQTLLQFLKKNSLDQRATIAPIGSVFMPDMWGELPVEAILITSDTENGAQAINKKRMLQKKPPLEIVSSALALGEGDVPISSTRIRSGVINRQGEKYIHPVFFEKSFQITKNVRDTLHKPFGQLIQFEKYDFSHIPLEKLITVGDITTHKFLKSQRYPQFAIVDFIVEREKKFSSFAELGFTGEEKIFYSANPAGQLDPSLLISIEKMFAEKEKRSILFIEGEEDLSALTVLLYAPLHYHIFYGQPHQGMVHIPVTEENKEKARRIMAMVER